MTPLPAEADYGSWREAKLAGVPADAGALVVEVGDLRALTHSERAEILRICARANMVIYHCAAAAGRDDPALVQALVAQLGLGTAQGHLFADDRGISALRVDAQKANRGYIPYTARRLRWHTDGYYHPRAQAIRAMVLHCVERADHGGENDLLDPELAWLWLRDRDVEFTRALEAPDAMTIPANEEATEAGRGAVSGPVFCRDGGGRMYMRYTSRTRSIVWKDDAATRDAVVALAGLLDSDWPYIFHHRLEPGQGLLCNNVLHNRGAFDPVGPRERLLYRMRFSRPLASAT